MFYGQIRNFFGVNCDIIYLLYSDHTDIIEEPVFPANLVRPG